MIVVPSDGGRVRFANDRNYWPTFIIMTIQRGRSQKSAEIERHWSNEMLDLSFLMNLIFLSLICGCVSVGEPHL